MSKCVTAIVVNWNAGENLVRCLEALISQEKVRINVVVVDNASSDGSLETLVGLNGRVNVVQTGENLGFGRGVNRGLSESTDEFVVVLNPDVMLAPDAVGQMVEFLDAYPQVGIVGPRLMDADGNVRASCGLAPRLGDEICRKFLLHLIFPLFKFRRRRPSKPEAVAWVTGACFAARYHVLKTVDGLDEAIFMYYEDVDLCLRVNRAGWQVMYLPSAEGVHIGGESSKQALTQMLVVSEASYAYFILKHLGRFSSLFLTLLRPVEMILRSLIWCMVFLLVKDRQVEARARLRASWMILKRGVAEEGL